MMVQLCSEDVLSWFRELKGHQRIPFMHQLIHMCHPLELRFIASCVEKACNTDYLALRSSEHQANSQTVLKALSRPVDEEARTKIIIYLCLLNSTNELCSRILNEKLCDHESVSQFCDDVRRHLIDGELPSSEKLQTLEELHLLYTLAFLHPAFSFMERQYYRNLCVRISELETGLKKLARQEDKQGESVVPKLCCDAGSHRDSASKTCSLCFSTSSAEHICKLRLLRRSVRPPGGPGGGEPENQVNVQWSTGKYSNLTIRDSQLKALHTELEGIISQPRLPAFPREPGASGHLNSYLQHLQGLSAVAWPRSEPVYQFFRHLADEQEPSGRPGPGGSPRPHSVYTPRSDPPVPPAPATNGLLITAEPHKLTVPLSNGTAGDGDDSEPSPPVLDDDAEVRSCTIYNSNLANGRPAGGSPLRVPAPAPRRSVSPADRSRPARLRQVDRQARRQPAAETRPSPPPAEPEPPQQPPPAGRTSVQRRRVQRTSSRSVSRDKEEPPPPPAVPPAPPAGPARGRTVTKTVSAPPAVQMPSTPPLRSSMPAVVMPSSPPLLATAPVPLSLTASPPPAPLTAVSAPLLPTPAAGAVPGGGGQTQTVPTFSAVTAHNVTGHADGGPLLDSLVFTAQTSPPFRAPVSSPSPPAAFHLPQYSARPPPPPPPPLGVVHLMPAAGFAAGPDHLPYYLSPLTYAGPPPPPPPPPLRAAPPPPPPPPPCRPRPEACYNCGLDHLGRYCPTEPPGGDASQQNQFKMSYVSSISDN